MPRARLLVCARLRLVGLLRFLALDPLLVESRGEALRESAAVGEDQGGGVLGDQVNDAFLDMRPDGGPLLGAGGRPAEVSGGTKRLDTRLWPMPTMNGCH